MFFLEEKIVMALAQGRYLPAELSWNRCWSYTMAGCHFSHSVQAQDQLPDAISGRKMMRERLWREFFRDPSQWWDHRSEKINPRYPDFKHKRTGQSLWLDNSLSPPWVEAVLAAMAPGLLQTHTFSWNVRLRRHLKNKDYKETLNLFEKMQRARMMPDKFTFVTVLNACSNLRSLEQGRLVHKQIIRRDCESDIYVANCLIDMYAKCGSIEDAWSVFNKMPELDVVSWSAMIAGCVKFEQGPKALDLFKKMQQEGVEPDAVTFVGVLKACASIAAVGEGRLVHKEIIRRGFQSDVYVTTCLIDMYAKCGSIEDACSVFNMMPERNVVSWNAMIGGYVKSEQGMKALEIFRKMQQEGVNPNPVSFVGALNACASLAALEEGRRVHIQISQRGYESNVYVANCLVDMYAKCGSTEDAWSVFIKMGERDVVSWSTMIMGYVKSEQGLKALDLFGKMQQEGVEPDVVTFIGALNACANVTALEEGRRVHEAIIQRGCQSNVYVATCLVDMYAKCRSIEDARSVFNKMRKRVVVSWSAMIGGYVKSEQGLKALELFHEMQQEGVEPDAVTFVGALNACASIAALGEGKRVHEEIIRRGWQSDVHVAACLVNMYVRCENIEAAWNVFNKMPERNVVSWNTMIVGYVKSAQGLKAMELFRKMQQGVVEPDAITFVGALNACASVRALDEGKHMHEQILQRGYESDVYVANCLVNMYAKCGSIEDAWNVFIKVRECNVVAWNAMIGGFVMSDQGLKALELFRKMHQEGVEPNTVTFVGVLHACARIAALEDGRHVHEQVIQRGCESDVHVASCLVDMYAKCGSIDDAWSVFKTMRRCHVVSWNAMIGAYVKSEEGLKALQLFQKMQQEGVDPNTVTFIGVLNACASLAGLEEGRHVHQQIIRRGCESNVYVATCLVDMYAKCQSIEDAWSVFKKMPVRNVVSWSAMIGGYVKSEQGLKALELFREMQQVGVEPNVVTFLGVLNACASVAALEEGRRVHKQIILSRCEDDVYIANCLVDMYAKCGSIEDARSVFNKMCEHDVVSWSAMIGGYAMHGHSKEAIGLLKRMGKGCLEVDQITFTCLLSACSHGGLVKEGLRYFNTITSHYSILPSWEHYACMVDLLGRVGRLEEAEDMTKRMPMKRNSSVWLSLLGACRIHGNIEMAERAAKWCLKLDPENESAHVLLSNIYAATGKWDRIAAIELERLKRTAWKKPGHTWIEVNNVVHLFVVDDKEHPQILQIHAELGRLSMQMNEVGYIPDMSFLLYEEKKESHLCCHQVPMVPPGSLQIYLGG